MEAVQKAKEDLMEEDGSGEEDEEDEVDIYQLSLLDCILTVIAVYQMMFSIFIVI